MLQYKLLPLIEKPKSRWLLATATATGTLVALSAWSLEARVLAAWDAGVLCLLTLIWLMMISANSEQTCDRAQRQEVDHRAIFLLVIFLAFTSLFAIATVLTKNKDSFTLEVGLSIVAIVCSWLLMHTMFVLHYAATYYRRNLNSEGILGGLEFSDAASPDYLDFVYFTFTLGMTSQTSDTAIVTSEMRRLALGHTIVSFYFYSVILALSVSIISGLL